MEKISQLMDGELSRRESKRQIRRLEEDHALSETWDTYHLIRDVLRAQTDVGPQFGQRMRARLTQEPVLVAPHARFGYRMVRYSLPLAAGVAGVALVGWLALSVPDPAPVATPAAHVASVAPKGSKGAMPAAPRRAAVEPPPEDYLLAHQEFSPSGFASYARTVSSDQAGVAR
jgi:sigma-E factor negative regulatory protein RseA